MNKIIIDLGDVYLATRTETAGESETTVTYGTPKKVCTASRIATTYTKGKTVVYESGAAVLNRPYVADAEVTVETATMPLADRMELYYGMTSAGNGEYEEGGDSDKPATKALGYSYKLSDGTYFCVWWYNASAQPADETGETSDDSGIKPQTDSIIFSCVKDPIKKLRRRVAICETESAVTTFFSSVVKAS